MEFPGHVGAALLAYAPIGFVTTVRSASGLALVGVLVTVALASLPDVDEHVSRLTHRGYVHTVWFALAVGVVCAGAFAIVGAARSGGSSVLLTSFGFVVGTAAVLSHVAADSLTPMGVAPFAPISDWRYSFRVTRSASPRANRLFLLSGLAVTMLAFGIGWFVR